MNDEDDDCEHPVSEPKNRVKNFKGEIFRYRARVCATCDAELWDEELQKSWDEFMMGVFERRPELFTISLVLDPKRYSQFQFARKFLDEFKTDEEAFLYMFDWIMKEGFKSNVRRLKPRLRVLKKEEQDVP